MFLYNQFIVSRLKTVIENGLRIHEDFIHGLKNQLRGYNLVKKMEFDTSIDLKISGLHGITLEELFKNGIILLIIGHIIAFLTFILEIMNFVKNHI